MAPEVQRLPTPIAVPDSPAYASHLNTLAFNSLTQALNAAQALSASVQVLSQAPTEERLNQAREQWRASYSAYLTSQAAVSIPVREPSEWYSARLTRSDLALQINSWPIEPGYIDYVDGYAFSGIVNDTALELTSDSLLNQHRFSDATYVSIGYPALEFMLWGEDGQRSASDFDTMSAKPAESDTSPVVNQGRRGQYLQLISQLLTDHLQRLQMRWSDSNGYYAQKLTEARPEKTLQASLMSIVQLIEDDLLTRYLAGEGSSPFSGGNSADARAMLAGIRQTLLPDNPSQGITPLLQQPEQIELLQGLTAHLADDSACGSGWQSAISHAEGQLSCRQQLIELLATLAEVNENLGLQVPLSD